MRDFFGNLPIVAGMGFSRGILLLDDCEGTFTYTVTGTGGDDVHEYLAAAAFQGTYGMHLKTRTTGAAANDVVTAYKYLAYPATGLLIARAKIACTGLAAAKTYGLTINANAGANTYIGTLLHSPNTPKTEYTNSAGAAVAIATMALTPLTNSFVDFELALDLKTMTYLHARWNGIHFDMAGIALYDGGAVAARYSSLAVSIQAIGAAPAEIYADNLYVGELLEA